MKEIWVSSITPLLAVIAKSIMAIIIAWMLCQTMISVSNSQSCDQPCCTQEIVCNMGG